MNQITVEFLGPVIAGLLNLLLSILTVSRVKSLQGSAAKITFSLFTFSLFVWSICIAISEYSNFTDQRILSHNIAYIAVANVSLYILAFSYFFPKKSNKHLMHNLVLIGAHISTLLLSYNIVKNPTYIFTNLTTSRLDNITEIPGDGYYLYALTTVSFLIISFVRFAKVLLDKDVSVDSPSIKKILKGLFVAAIFSIPANLILPSFGYNGYSWIGPISTLFYVFMIFQAVTKYRFFDIRLIFIRTIIYTVLVTLCMLAYIIGGKLFIEKILQYDFEIGTQSLYIISSIVIAISFQPIRKLFNRLTNRILYRHTMNPLEVIEKLDDLVAKESDTSTLLNQSLLLINSSLKSQNSTIHVFHNNKHYGQAYIGEYVSIRDKGIKEILKKHDLFIASEAEHIGQLKNFLADNIELIMKIYNPRKDTLAILILGQKTDGRSYNQTDVDLLKKFAKSLSLALENSVNYTKIKDFSKTLQTEITIATEELKKSNKKLKKLDVEKNEFMSMAAHQLKPQLSAARGFNELLQEESSLNKNQSDLVNMSSISVERMIRIVSDMLNLSRFGSSGVKINSTSSNLNNIVSQEVKRMYITAQEKNIKIELSNEEVENTYFDEVKIREIVMNLINNAVQYSPKKSIITINLKKIDNSLQFTVTDKGIGVPQNEQKYLFKKFYRATNAKEQRPSGTGVGLFMAKKFIQSHDGEIIFKSKENSGSTFGFIIPFKPGLSTTKSQ